MVRVSIHFWGRGVVAALLVSGSLMTAACAQGDKATPVPKKDKAEAPGPARKIWEDAPGYDLFVGAAEDGDARVFQSPDFQKLLIVPGKGDLAFLLTLKTKDVSSVARTDVTAVPDGGYLADAAEMKPVGMATQKAADLSFQVSGATLRLAPEPPLIGEVALADLLKKKKEYATAAAQYRPNGAAVSLIKTTSQRVELVVFFGTWCHICKKHLPRLIKTLEAAGNPNITARFIGIDEEIANPEALIMEYRVSKTPTVIVRVNNQELGRIVEDPKKSMEEDLALLLSGGQ